MSFLESVSRVANTQPVAEIWEFSPDDDFCHICEYDDDVRCYCGHINKGLLHEEYDGQAICATCGLPTCPKCAVLADLEDRLEEAL